jgi:hypothetical protein
MKPAGQNLRAFSLVEGLVQGLEALLAADWMTVSAEKRRVCPVFLRGTLSAGSDRSLTLRGFVLLQCNRVRVRR